MAKDGQPGAEGTPAELSAAPAFLESGFEILPVQTILEFYVDLQQEIHRSHEDLGESCIGDDISIYGDIYKDLDIYLYKWETGPLVFTWSRLWILLQSEKAGKRAGTIHRSRIGPGSSGLCSFQAGLGFSPPFLPKGGEGAGYENAPGQPQEHGVWAVGSSSQGVPTIPAAPRGRHRAEIRGCSSRENLPLPPRASPSLLGNEGTNTPGAGSRGQSGMRKPYHLFLLIFRVLH